MPEFSRTNPAEPSYRWRCLRHALSPGFFPATLPTSFPTGQNPRAIPFCVRRNIRASLLKQSIARRAGQVFFLRVKSVGLEAFSRVFALSLLGHGIERDGVGIVNQN